MLFSMSSLKMISGDKVIWEVQYICTSPEEKEAGTAFQGGINDFGRGSVSLEEEKH